MSYNACCWQDRGCLRTSPEFSVVIPTYNRLEFLKQALSSVWAQTFKNYEIIVVDDGSTDDTNDYLASLTAPTKALRQENSGPAAARNLGVEQARGNYVAFLDSDDFWFPWALATIHKVIQHHSQPSLISVATSEFEGELPKVAREKITTEFFHDYFTTAAKPSTVRSAALVIKRKIFNWANGFDEGMLVGEDLDFYFRVGTAGGFVHILSPVTLGYRRHAGNMSTVPLALYSAAVELLKREAEDCYPGGEARRIERWKLLSRAVRPMTLSCLRAGLKNEAWELYRKSFRINAHLGRVRFLVGFPLHGLASAVGHRAQAQRPKSQTHTGPHGLGRTSG